MISAGSVALALLLPCIGMTAVFVVYILLLCNAVGPANSDLPVVKPSSNRGLSGSDLERLPRVAGRDLVLGTDCAVCLDEVGSDQPARMVPGCNHGFHLECADAWLSKNPICPMCRAKVVFDDPPAENNNDDSPC